MKRMGLLSIMVASFQACVFMENNVDGNAYQAHIGIDGTWHHTGYAYPQGAFMPSPVDEYFQIEGDSVKYVRYANDHGKMLTTTIKYDSASMVLGDKFFDFIPKTPHSDTGFPLYIYPSFEDSCKTSIEKEWKVSANFRTSDSVYSLTDYNMTFAEDTSNSCVASKILIPQSMDIVRKSDNLIVLREHGCIDCVTDSLVRLTIKDSIKMREMYTQGNTFQVKRETTQSGTTAIRQLVK